MAHDDTPTLAPALASSFRHLLAHATLAVEAEVARELETLGLTPRHVGVLANIAHNGPMTQRALGDLLAIDRTTMVGLIDALEAQGLVARERHPEDRRAWAITLTARGETTQEWAARMTEQSEQRALAALTERQRGELARLLAKLAG